MSGHQGCGNLVLVEETFEQRYPVVQAIEIVATRIADGWSLLGVDGLWVEDSSVRPDLGFIFDGSPDGSRDVQAISSMLASWPHEESFCVEVLMIR